MSDELEGVGAAATAGLAAAAIEGREARKAGEAAQCANCGAAVEGRYCANCGQATYVHRSLWHLLEEALHGLVHFDSKMWRTLPRLALRPGTLTRDYIEGRRARYVSPLALFLFCIFLMFAVFAFTGGAGALRDADVVREEPSAAEGLRQASAELAVKEARARAAGETQAAEVQAATRAVLDAAAEKGAARRVEGGDVVVAPETLSQALKKAARRSDFDLGNERLNQAARKAIENPELLLYKIQQAAYKFAFLLIPISLPFIALLFLWKRGVTWFDHTVFALYSLSFMSMFFLFASLLSSLVRDVQPLSGLLSTTMFLAPPMHMFFQLGGAYKLGWFSALWRTLALLTICGVSFLTFLTLIVAIGVLG